MNGKLIARMLANIIILEALFMLPSVGLALYDGDITVMRSFILVIGIMALTALITRLLTRKVEMTFYAREGFLLVAVTWVIASLYGALPFVLSGEIPHFLDAFFETVSGFTTTGASILTRVEELSRASLYWRSFTHWLGGMGILVFMLAVVPTNKDSGHSIHLLRAESPGPSVEKIVPRAQKHAKVLYSIYIGLTVLCFLCLIASDMPVFDSLCITFGTAGTGGFGILSDSMASYHISSQVVVTVFMMLFGINFNVYFLLLYKRVRAAFRDEELLAYLGIMLFTILLVTFNVLRQFEHLGLALHHASFTISSIMTTTGYTTANYNLWPEFSRAILVVLMMIGACAGSTGGGVKVVRLLILIKTGLFELRRMLHPRSVSLVKVNGKGIGSTVQQRVHIYLFSYIGILFLSFLLISIDDFSLETNLTAVISCINNIGPGLGAVGPDGNFANFSYFSKGILTLNMLLGRLEFYPILIVLHPRSWSRAT